MSRAPVFRTFTDFYPFYLGEHTHPTCRRLHFIGTTLAVALLLTALVTQRWVLLLVALIEAYPSLSPEHITGHSDIAPGRKSDPGPAFDWPRLRALLARRLAASH